jgi:hypothetical protein
MIFTLDFVSAILGALSVMTVAIIRYKQQKHFPIGDILTVLFLGALIPVAIYYPVSAFFPYYPELSQYVVANSFNPLYQVLIGFVLLRYLKDYMNEEFRGNKKTPL